MWRYGVSLSDDVTVSINFLFKVYFLDYKKIPYFFLIVGYFFKAVGAGATWFTFIFFSSEGEMRESWVLSCVWHRSAVVEADLFPFSFSWLTAWHLHSVCWYCVEFVIISICVVFPVPLAATASMWPIFNPMHILTLGTVFCITHAVSVFFFSNKLHLKTLK